MSDSIKKEIVLHAPQSRVWKALTDASQFSAWFGVQLNGEFVAGKAITGSFGKGINEDAIMEYQKKNGVKPSKVRMPEENSIFCTVERMEPQRYFSFRWIPYGVDAEADPKNEPTTLVEFTLEPTANGTVLTIVESGFDKVPAHRRERAFRMNTGGWEGQSQNVKKYVEST